MVHTYWHISVFDLNKLSMHKISLLFSKRFHILHGSLSHVANVFLITSCFLILFNNVLIEMKKKFTTINKTVHIFTRVVSLQAETIGENDPC